MKRAEMALTAREKECCGSEDCKKTIQSLKNQLRLKAAILKKLQGMVKQNGRNVATDMASEYEKLLADKEAALLASSRLNKENEMLGKAIDKLKTQQRAKEEQSIQEVQQKYGALKEEYEEYKSKHEISARIAGERNQLQEEVERLRGEQQKWQSVAQDECMRIKAEEELKGQKQQTEIEELLENNRKLNEVADELKEKFAFYKSKYIEEAKYSLRLQEREKTLVAESQTHVQYITILEAKCKSLEQKLEQDERQFRDRSVRLEDSAYSIPTKSKVVPTNRSLAQCHDSIEEPDIVFGHQIHTHLQEQMERLKETSELAQTNLCMSRHNMLQHCMKLQECEDRLIALEKMRLSDLLHISRLENLLTAHSIKF